MKKIFLALCACTLVLMGSCKSDKADNTDNASTPTEETAANNATEEKAAPSDIDPYIAKLMENDSTVKVTPSGLGYKVIKQGNGSVPSESNTAKVKYVGKHTDGTEFDSSKGNVVDFPLQNVVPGFREGITLMPVGSVYELYIPGKLGYGERGIPQAGIQPNELLVFEVELTDFM